MAVFTVRVVAAYQDPKVQHIVQQDGSPLRLSGIITAKDRPSESLRYSFERQLTATNLSKKSILLVVLQVSVADLGDQNSKNIVEDDYFFGPNVMAPDAIRAFDQTIGPFGTIATPGTDDKPKEPEATSSVLFLQFGDGSTWGDLKNAERPLQLRQKLWTKLKELNEVYETKGRAAFGTSLLEPSDLAVILNFQHQYRADESGAVANKIKTMLHFAEVHQGAATAAPAAHRN